MSIALTFNGQNYIIPTTNEVGWGSNLDDYLVAIAAGALQKTGGNFTLAADVDFGGAFGLKAQYFKSRSINPALGGVLRLANGDLISWRNSTNTSDLSLTVNSLNQLVYNGTPLQQVSLVSAHILVGNASNIATDVAMTGDVSITNAGLTAVNNIQPLVITDAMINASAAIVVSKLAALPINQVVLTDGSGILTGAGVVAPLLGQVLTYNGATWVNATPTNTSAGAGVVLFPVDTATSAGQFLLSATPELVEQTDSAAVTSATSPIIIEGYRSSGLGRTQLEAGVWSLDLWRAVTAGGVAGVQTIVIEFLRRFAGAGTVTITGAGATRTCTVTGGTPFVAGDANANITLAGQVETPTGVFPITAFSSSSVVTLTTGAGYVNETGVAYFVQRFLFNLTTGEINDTAITQQTIDSVQPAFTGFSTSDELAMRLYATNDQAGSRTLSYTHGGSTRSSHLHTPLVTLHNSLAGLQGGAANEYYHMTSLQNSVLDASSSIQTQLNGKASTTLNNLGVTSFNADIIPAGNFARSIGSPSHNLSAIYAQGLGMGDNALNFSGIISLLPGITNGGAVAIRSRAQAADFSYEVYIPGVNANSDFVLTEGNQTINGVKTFAGQLIGKGTVTNDNAASGYIGEFVKSAVTAVSVGASGVYSNATSISLTAGDWDVTGQLLGVKNAATMTNPQQVEIYLSAYSGSATTDLVFQDNAMSTFWTTSNANSDAMCVANWRVSITSTTTIYLKGLCTFSAGTPQWYGRISARRVR